MALENVGKLAVFTFLLCLSSFLVVEVNCVSCKDSSECVVSLGDYSECKNGSCVCQDFFVLHPNNDTTGTCIKMSPYGATCQESIQCQAYLGKESMCNKANASSLTGTCTCFSADPADMLVHHKGTCYAVRELGDPCSDDNQCILKHHGTTNELARCIDNVCACYSNSVISLTSEDVDGLCMGTGSGKAGTSMSVFAITICGSVALLLFIYAMFRIAKKTEPKDVMPVFKAEAESSSSSKSKRKQETDQNGGAIGPV